MRCLSNYTPLRGRESHRSFPFTGGEQQQPAVPTSSQVWVPASWGPSVLGFNHSTLASLSPALFLHLLPYCAASVSPFPFSCTELAILYGKLPLFKELVGCPPPAGPRVTQRGRGQCGWRAALHLGLTHTRTSPPGAPSLPRLSGGPQGEPPLSRPHSCKQRPLLSAAS